MCKSSQWLWDSHDKCISITAFQDGTFWILDHSGGCLILIPSQDKGNFSTGTCKDIKMVSFNRIIHHSNTCRKTIQNML